MAAALIASNAVFRHGSPPLCSPSRRYFPVSAALKPTRKGFGPPPPPAKTTTSNPPSNSKQKIPSDDEDEDEDEDEDVVPQMVTDRMLKRIAFTVGIPLGLGLLFFPFFWYLKVIQKVDVPEWLPLLVSGICFGSSGLGITYGIVSTSWDPQREGTLLGWKEAQANWPLFFENLRRKR